MANIKVSVNTTIKDGSEIVFLAPCDCTDITGLNVEYVSVSGYETNSLFKFKDAHGNDLSDADLFAKGAYVKVILDNTNGIAYVQNADTNKYLEGKFKNIDNKFDEHTKASNPHKLTKSDVGLGNVDNKSSSTIRSEITKKNVSDALGFTPSKVGYIVNASSTDGINYVASTEEIESLERGMTIVLIPLMDSIRGNLTLNINSLGKKRIIRRLSGLSNNGFLTLNEKALSTYDPVLLIYDGYDDWYIDSPKPTVEDLYGIVPITSGGTGANNKIDALKNLGIDSLFKNIQYNEDIVDLTANECMIKTKQFDKAFSKTPIVLIWLQTPTGAIYSNLNVWIEHPNSSTQFKYHLNSSYNGVLSNIRVCWLAFEL